MPITRISHNGKSWPIEDFVKACLTGECDYPAPIAKTILENHKDYDNKGTISGSQLHAECDYMKLLERLPYTKEISDMYWATFRGSNVHAMIERCKGKPGFEDWIFEERFFGFMDNKDEIHHLEIPRLANGEIDEVSLKSKIVELRRAGNIVFSGQVDAYDKRNRTLEDWKTTKQIDEWTRVKTGWQHQMNHYSLLLFLADLKVDRIRITVMDSSLAVNLEVPVPNLEGWAGAYLVSRARYLSWLQSFSPEDIQAINEGQRPRPKGFPEPKVNHLCSGGRDGKGKVYCPSRLDGSCPAWRKTNQEEAPLPAQGGADVSERPSGDNEWI